MDCKDQGFDFRYITQVQEVLRLTIEAITAFLAKESDLLDVNTNERSLTHKLAEHLGPRFPEWHVDCEYNRLEDAPKRLPPKNKVFTDDTEGRTIFPDVIVHKRQIRDNLLVIEVKKASNKNSKNDISKLEGLTRDDGCYGYVCGLHLIIDCESKTPTGHIYVAGSYHDELSKWYCRSLQASLAA